MKQIKIGVIGLGERGRQLATLFSEQENVLLSAVCDRKPECLLTAKKQLEEKGAKNLQCFEDAEGIFRSDVDAVCIATDGTYHLPLVVRALNAGKHVLSEIPAINSLDEAKQLKEVTKQHPDLTYMIAENCCYWAFIQAWKTMYEEGRLGEIVYAEGEYLHAKDFREYLQEDGPVDDWRRSYPAIQYITHSLGPLLYLMNDRCTGVTCLESDIIYNPYKQNSQNGVALLKTEKGAIIKILISFGAYVGFDHNYRLLGTKGTVETDRTKPLYQAHSFGSFSEIPGSLEEKIDIPVTLQFPGESEEENHGGADRKMIAEFVTCISENKKPSLDVDLAIQMALPGIFAHESAKMGGIPMEIPIIE